MADKKKNKSGPPEINPFVFPIALAIMGIWFFYDGWLSTDPDMQGHLMFNRIGSGILLPWAVIDFFRTWRSEKEYRKKIVVTNIATLDDN